MKRTMVLAATIALVAVAATPSHAAPKPKVVVEDVSGDANFLNDQGTGDGSFGDNDAATASDFADIRSVGFSNDKKNVYAFIETGSAAQPSAGEGFRVRVNPDGPGGIYCLNFEIMFNGAQNDMTEPKAHLRDACNANEQVEAEVELSIHGGFMITVPRSAHEALGSKKTLAAAQAQTFLWSGSYPNGVAGPYLDTTKPGKDYKLR